MTGILNLLAGAVGVVKDTYFNLVTLLLPGDGTNGAQNNTFLDSSTNNFTITRNGNTTQGTFSPFSQTGWGNYFNGSSDGLSLTSSTALSFGTGDFTIETWIYRTGSNEDIIYEGRASEPSIVPHLQVNPSGYALFYVNGAARITGTTVLATNTWHHVAVSRSGTSTKLFVNGTQDGSTYTDSNNYTIGATVYIGRDYLGSASAYTQGYLSNLRVTKGGALYTSAFTPSTTPLTTTVSAGTVSLLTCQSNRFIDNSSNAFAITTSGTPSVQAFSPFAPTAAYSASTNGGSGYFDGTGDYLTGPNASGGDFGSGDFTISFWYYPVSSANYGLVSYADTSGWNGWQIQQTGSNTIKFEFLSGSAGVSSITGGTVYANQWNYVVITRSGSTVTLYTNSTSSAGTSTNSSSYGVSGSRVIVGNERSVSPGTPFNGYLSSVKLVKQANTPSSIPTAPDTNTTNTSLLLNFTNGGIIDATGKNDLETVGNAQISTTQSKFGGSSMYFDGTGDYLYANSSASNAAFGTGDFTVEFWLYTAAGSTTYNLLDWRPTSTNGSYLTVYLDAGVPKVAVNGSNVITGGAGISATTWTHVAVCRSGTSTKMFINGTQSGSTYTDSTNYIGVANRPAIGGGGYDTASTLNGYIDDLRVTKGYARYTSNFTAPTAAFPLQ